MFDDTVVELLRSGGCVLLESKCGVVGHRNYASSGRSSAILRDSPLDDKGRTDYLLTRPRVLQAQRSKQGFVELNEIPVKCRQCSSEVI